MPTHIGSSDRNESAKLLLVGGRQTGPSDIQNLTLHRSHPKFHNGGRCLIPCFVIGCCSRPCPIVFLIGRNSAILQRSCKLTRSKSLSTVAFLLGICALLSANTCSATNYYVRQTGSDTNTGRSRNAAFRTVGKAIAECSTRDVVYVGAGTYDDAITKRFTSSGESLRIVGDTTGRYTGDAGKVVFRPKAGRWFLNIGDMGSLHISNVQFTDPGIKTGYAIYATSCTNYVYAIDCEFNRLRHGFFAVDVNFAMCFRSSFTDNIYGYYSRTSRYAYTYECDFESCRYGASVHDADYAYFFNCSTNADPSITGGYSRAFYALRSRVYASNLTCKNGNYGLVGTELQSAYVANCTIDTPKNAGVQLAGTGLTCSAITVTGAGTNTGYGLILNDTEGGTFTVQNCSATKLYGGLLMYSTGTLSQVEFAKNHIGIRFIGGDDEIAIDGRSGVRLEDNVFGIYGYAPSGTQGDLLLSNLEISGGTYGIYTSRMSTQIRNQVITEALNPIRVHECESFQLVDARLIAGSREGANTGALIYSTKTKINDVSIDGFRAGLNLQNQSNSAPEISNCTLTNCSSYAMHIRKGRARFDASSNIKIVDCRIGIYPYECDLIVDGLPEQERCEYPFYCIYGSLQASNLVLSKHRKGIYSNFQTKTVLRDCTVSECLGWGIDVRNADSLQISNVQSNQNVVGGFHLYRPRQRISVMDSSARGNSTYGIYCNAEQNTPNAKFENVHCSGSTYGFRSIGLPVNNSTVDGLEIVDNNHGLRVEKALLTLNAKSNVRLSGNSYGLMSYYGQLSLTDFELQGNTNGVYCRDSPVAIDGCKVSSDNYGVLAYRGGSKISNSSFSTSRYGVYFSPRNVGDRTLSIEDCSFSDIRSIGLYSYGYQGDASVDATRLRVESQTHAVYSISTDFVMRNSVLNSGVHALYGRNGRVRVDNCEINSVNGWGVLDYNRELRIDNSQIRSRHGVYLRCEYAKLRNNVIQGSTYGVYGNLDSGKHEILQSTIGNITHYGIYRVAGEMVVRNTIVDAEMYALVNSNRSGSLEHDHNLVHANRANFVGVTAGIEELQKDPIFLDPSAGDLHLAAGSPAINSGMDLSNELTTDIEGNARPSFKQFEIGAYEFTEQEGSIRVLEWEEKAQ